MDRYTRQRGLSGTLHDAKIVGGIEDCTMGGADESLNTGVVIDVYSLVCAGPLTGYEIAIGETDEHTAVSIGWIGEALAVVDRHIRGANHRPRMS